VNPSLSDSATTFAPAPLGVLTILAPLACAHIEAPTTAAPSVANPPAAHPRYEAREVVSLADSGSSLPQAPKPLGTDPGSSARDARTATPVESAHPEAADPPIIYPLVVSFGSACCGTNRDAARTIERLLDAYLPEALGPLRRPVSDCEHVKAGEGLTVTDRDVARVCAFTFERRRCGE